MSARAAVRPPRPGAETRVNPSAARNGRELRHEAGRFDILTAAATLIAERGYHGMSMRDLARGSGMSLANLYNYFGSKEDVLFELQVRAFETLIATAEEEVDATPGADARLYAFMLSHVRYVIGHRDILRVLVEEAGELPAPRRRAVRALKERYRHLGLAVVREVVQGGGRAGLPELDGAGIERATFGIFGMLNWVYAWYDPARHGSAQDVARTLHRMAQCGLVARCPRRAALSATERRAARRRVPSPMRLRARRSERGGRP